MSASARERERRGEEGRDEGRREEDGAPHAHLHLRAGPFRADGRPRRLARTSPAVCNPIGEHSSVELGSDSPEALPWSLPHSSSPPLGPLCESLRRVLIAATLSKSKVGAAVVFALSLMATLLGTVVCADAFLQHESPVYALLFISILALQWELGVAVIVAAIVLRSWQAAAAR